MAWDWSALPSDAVVSHGEVLDAIADGDLDWDTSAYSTTEENCYSRSDYALHIEHDGTALSGSGIPTDALMTKQQMLDYAVTGPDVTTVTPGSFSVAQSGLNPSYVLCSWNNTGADTSWDYQIARCSGGGCTPTSVILSGTVSGTNQNRLDDTTVEFTAYSYRMRYHDGSQAGPWTSTQTITTGEDNEPT